MDNDEERIMEEHHEKESGETTLNPSEEKKRTVREKAVKWATHPVPCCMTPELLKGLLGQGYTSDGIRNPI